MGWARTLFLGDIGNRLDIADTERSIEDVRGELASSRRLNQSQDEAIQQLQRENEQLELCVAALVRTLERKGLITQDEVKNLVDKIDG
jgi:predicted  nucleic acid-binding Zn-ribbon protein